VRLNICPWILKQYGPPPGGDAIFAPKEAKATAVLYWRTFPWKFFDYPSFAVIN